MATKTTAKKTDEGEDLLGVVAFGSLIANIFQIASKDALEKQHEQLKAYAKELHRHYENMKIRQRHIYNQNLELVRASKELLATNNQLLNELITCRQENMRLKSGKSSIRRRRILKTPATE